MSVNANIAKKILSRQDYFGQINEAREPHGYGVRTGLNRKYEGEFRNGEATGYGRLTYADGSVFCGEFRADRPHGYGHYTSDHGGYGLWEKDSDKIDQYAAMDNGEPGEEDEANGRPAAEHGQEAAEKAIAASQSPEAEHVITVDNLADAKLMAAEINRESKAAEHYQQDDLDLDQYDDDVLDEPEPEDGETGICNRGKDMDAADAAKNEESWDHLQDMARKVGGGALLIIIMALRKLFGGAAPEDVENKEEKQEDDELLTALGAAKERAEEIEDQSQAQEAEQAALPAPEEPEAPETQAEDEAQAQAQEEDDEDGMTM